jgi:hypothetical protein
LTNGDGCLVSIPGPGPANLRTAPARHLRPQALVRNRLLRVPANTDGSGFPGLARPARRHGMEIRNARSRPQASDGICRRPRTVLLRCRDRHCALPMPLTLIEDLNCEIWAGAQERVHAIIARAFRHLRPRSSGAGPTPACSGRGSPAATGAAASTTARTATLGYANRTDFIRTSGNRAVNGARGAGTEFVWAGRNRAVGAAAAMTSTASARESVPTDSEQHRSKCRRE